ncbi:GM26594 [Drosophila sechellia]|uniref:GM26594 n=2 Tax=Drosophila sechellia TaxID=7238 RepID=B4HH12_DROSE|nr:GM26594 [Drosophila sechellia]
MYRSKLQNVGDFGQVILLLITLIRPIHGLLLFPTSTVLQLTSSVSIPADLNTRTKVFTDMGFQMNYNLPPTVSAFYNATIWADELSRRQKRQLDNSLVSNLQQWDLEGGMHPGDFTAGQLYKGIENMLETYGFHRSCLLRSVCELALHPFAEDHFYGMITQVITFLLT